MPRPAPKDSAPEIGAAQNSAPKLGANSALVRAPGTWCPEELQGEALQQSSEDLRGNVIRDPGHAIRNPVIRNPGKD